MGMAYREEPFERVLSAARDDAPWAYERLYRSLSPAICGYLRVQGAADPEDLTSEVFLPSATSGRSRATRTAFGRGSSPSPIAG